MLIGTEKIKIDQILQSMIYGSLMILAAGLLTSPTLLALSHIFIFIPTIYFSFKIKDMMISKSRWSLLAIITAILFSILFNQDISVNGFKSLLKIKYFLVGLLTPLPLMWYFEKYATRKKIKTLLYVLCIGATVATLIGLISMKYGYNPVTRRAVEFKRNAGLFGMLMNYAHNLSFFLIIIFGLIINKESIGKLLNKKFLIIVFIINLIGLYLTYTRGAWLALLAGLPIYYLKNNKKVFLTIFLLLVALGIGVYFFAGDKVIRPGSDRERISQWKAATFAARERPLLGYGYLNFEHHTGKIKKRYGIEKENFVGHAHNNFFEMLGSTGLIGLFAFCAWIIFWFWEDYKSKNDFSHMSLAFLTVFVVGGLTQSTISLGINLFFIMAFFSVRDAITNNNEVKS